MTRKVLASALFIVTIACGSETPTTPTPERPPSPPATAHALSGTVRDQSGAPLQGASVAVGADPRRSGYGSATSDASGHYLVTGLYLGSQPVFVGKSGYVRIFETVEIAPGAVKDFALRPGVIVSGRIVEDGVGPLNAATITVISGPDAGLQTTTAVIGGFSLPPVLPGDFIIRASKPGYDSVDRSIHATADVYLADITMKWAFGSCLSSVTPVLFDRVSAAGARAPVVVQAQGDRRWTAAPDVPWVNVVANASATGTATLQFEVQPNPLGAVDIRSGTIQIRCSATEGQNVWITQMVNCQATAEPDARTPRVFPAEGGIGRLVVRFGVPGCRARDYSEADWMSLAGAGSYMSGEVNFIVQPNTTGRERTGVLVIGETRWSVMQGF